MKLNKEIAKLMPKEYQVLWALSKESLIKDSSIRRMLINKVNFLSTERTKTRR